jgi:uncharacterized DUF497 family protein
LLQQKRLATYFVATTTNVEIEFDPKKSAKNAGKRGLPFDLARDAFNWDEAHIIEDERHAYGERRFLAFAPMHGRLHVIC